MGVPVATGYRSKYALKKKEQAKQKRRKALEERNRSNRASMARDMLGERLFTDWNVTDILTNVEYICMFCAIPYDEEIEADWLEKDIFCNFLFCSSRHHVDGVMRDFYYVDPMSVWEHLDGEAADSRERCKTLKEMLDGRQSVSMYGKAPSSPKVIDARGRYLEEHGFASNSVAAFEETYPGRVEHTINELGKRVAVCDLGNGKTFVCLESAMDRKFVTNFDATEKNPWYDNAPAANEVRRDSLIREYGSELPYDELVAIVDRIRHEFRATFGYDPTSVYAYKKKYPERVTKSKIGGQNKYTVKIGHNGQFICLVADAKIKSVNGFDMCADEIRSEIAKRIRERNDPARGAEARNQVTEAEQQISDPVITIDDFMPVIDIDEELVEVDYDEAVLSSAGKRPDGYADALYRISSGASTRKEAAESLGIHPNTLRRWMKEDGIDIPRTKHN
jgi:hypothetical protein